MGLADCNIAGTRGVSCAREMKVKDFRVLRALMELHAQGESVTVDGIVDYLKKQRYDTVPFYDDTIVNSAIQLGVAQRLICTTTKLKPTRYGEDLVNMTMASNDPELGTYRVWSSKVAIAPCDAVVAG